MWEAGKKKPTRDNLQALADLYGVSMDYLIGREETEKEQTQNDEEIELLAIYRQLNAAGRAALLAAAEGMLAQPGLRQVESIASEG
jgi:transcriptional regulator with XRE-family HTH domain